MIKCEFQNLLLFAAIALFTGGCIHPNWQAIGSYEKDVSHKEFLWGGYIKDQEYVLIEDVFISEVKSIPITEYAIIPPRALVPGKYNLYYSAPESDEVYMRYPSRWPKILAVLEKGKKIRCKKVIQEGALLWGSSITVYAEIIDESYSDIMVDIHDISITSREKSGGVYLYYPNENILKYVDSNIEDEQDSK